MTVSKLAFMHARYESIVRDYYEVKEEGWISKLWKYCFINAYGPALVLGWSWGYEKCEFAIVGSLIQLSAMIRHPNFCKKIEKSALRRQML